MIFSNKKGEKELQMIFGLFVLLIISLVVLMMFLKFTKKSANSMTSAQGDFFAKSKINSAIASCRTACSDIQGSSNVDSSAIEFCSKFVRIDGDGDGHASPYTKYDGGSFIACEDKVPCFILVPNCGEEWSPNKEAIYTPSYCRNLLIQDGRDDLLSKLMYDSPKATCNLPVKGEPGYKANWVLKYGYYNTSKYNPDGTTK